MYEYPFGNSQQLNLDWFLAEWINLLAAWKAEKNGIEGALQAEIDRAEAALADVFSARDAAAQSAANALESKNAAAQSAKDASGYLATVHADANTASNAAQNAAQSQTAAGNSASAAAKSQTAAENSASAAAQSQTAAENSASTAAQSQTAAENSASAAAQSAEDAENAASSVENSAQQIATNTNDIIKLKESLNNLTISKKILNLIKTYPNGSVSAGNRTFTVNDNIVSSSGTGSNTTYYQINLTGSILRARSGSKTNFAVYDEDFVATDIINRFPANSWYSMLFKKYVLVPPTSSTEVGYIYIFGKKANDDTIYRNIQTISIAYNVALDIAALLNDYEKFAIYYTRGVSNANRDNALMFEFDITRPVTKVVDAIASSLENP